MKTPHNILEKYWGYTSFRPKQEAIIKSVLNGRDTVALLPTGGGKSLCFQIPALILEGLCIVVSPLVALMNDQVATLKEKGIKALALTGGLAHKEVLTTLENATYGNYRFLYISPERLQQEIVQNAIKQMPVSLIAVDEAHCISQWGNDFRPAYKNIHFLRKLHPLVPIIALTATATPDVLEDTIASLQMEMSVVISNSFTRSNLAYQVFEETDKIYHIEQLLKGTNGNAIIYVRSRKSTVDISKHLNALGIRSDFFHGGISTIQKKQKLQHWKTGVVPVMIATNAFGMGIDHPNVRFVIHTQLPESIESYFQEAGRAGRDNAYARAIILYNTYDKQLVQRQYIDALATVKDLKYIYRKLSNYFQVPYGEGQFEQHSFSFTTFCKTYDLPTTKTYNALQSLDRLAIIQLSKEFGQKSTIHFTAENKVVLNYFNNHPLASVIGKTILRIYGGVFEMPTKINLELIQSKTGQSIPTIIKTLEQFEKDNLISLSLHITDASVTFLQPREDDKTINVIAKEIIHLNNKKKAQVQQLLQYVANDTICKSIQLVSYFGEQDAIACGICSVCIKKSENPSKSRLLQITNAIQWSLEEEEKTSKQLAALLEFNATEILEGIQLLLDNNTIGIDAVNRYYIK